MQKYHQGDKQEQPQDELVTEKSDSVEEKETGMNRPRRERRLPERFDEYLLYK